MNKDNITYSFSTALRMMRYGGAKMRSVLWTSKPNAYVTVKGGSLCQTIDGITVSNCDLYSKEILGSWVEVK